MRTPRLVWTVALAAAALATLGCRGRCCPRSLSAPKLVAATPAAPQVLMEMTLCLANAAEGSEALLGLQPPAGTSRVLAPAEAERVRQVLALAPRSVEQLVAPSVVAVSGEEASVVVGDTGPGGWGGVRSSARATVEASGALRVTLHVAQRSGSGDQQAERRIAVDDVSIPSGHTILLVGERATQGKRLLVLFTPTSPVEAVASAVPPAARGR